MARYDKYDPISGGFRGLLNAALTLTDGSFMGAVSLNSSGRVVPGTAGQSGLVGVVVKNVARGPVGTWDTSMQAGLPNPNAPIGALAGDVVDIMTAGEIVDLDTTVFAAGKIIYTTAAGVLSTTSASGSTAVGWTVEAGRAIIRVAASRTPVA